jgi:uncharacterized protein (TIGR03437 family)
LPRFRFPSFIAIAAALLLAGAAHAQTYQSNVANLAPISGNGQLICPTCPFGSFAVFEPLVAQATDSSGNPLAGVTVAWSTPDPVVLLYNQTTTDQNGLTQNTIFPGLAVAGSTYQQANITASAGSASAIFTETQSMNGPDYVIASLVAPNGGTSYAGVAGSQGSPLIQVHVSNSYAVIPGVSLRLVSPSGGTPPMSCVTGNGADPGSVLTDANGNASCTPLFGSAVVSGAAVLALVGGVNSSVANNGLPYGFWASSPFFVTVTPSVPGLIAKVGGNGQSANPGQPLAAALQVKVTDAAGVATIANTGISWTVAPAGAATLGSATTTTDANGLSQNTVRLSSSAAGQILVTATVTSVQTLSTTFTVIANATVAGITASSGGGQTAVVGTPFAQQLVAQVIGSNGQPLANYGVAFSVNGPGIPSATSVPTDSNGYARVSMTAGSSTGTVTVTATAGTYTATFTLTVVPAGPQITSFTNGAQFYTSYDANHSALSPCGIGTAFGTGIAPSLQGVATGSSWGPLPYTLDGVQVSFNSSQAPIYNVSNNNGVQSVTFQVPCDVTTGNAVPVVVQVNGGTANLTTIVRAAGPGIFESVQSDGVLRAVLEKADGSFVTPANPARGGEVIRMFATGLGATLPAVTGTDDLAPLGAPATVRAQLFVGINNAGAPLVDAQLSSDLLGVYTVDFLVPTTAPQGNNIVLSLAANAIDGSVTQFSAGSKIPILP